jgi:hypothetical protein
MSINVSDISLFGQNVSLDRIPQLSSGLVSSFGYFSYMPSPEGHISTMVEDTISLLVEQFRRDRPGWSGFIRSVALQMQEIEDMWFDLLRFRAISRAAGIQLDKIGEIVGLSRTSGDDTIYRKDLYFQIWLNKSNGEPETLIAVLRKATGGTIDYSEPCPATVQMTINQSLSGIPDDIYAKMRRVKPAGVALELRYNNSTSPFTFGGDMNPPTPPYFLTGGGFGETSVHQDNSAIGGNITELIS